MKSLTYSMQWAKIGFRKDRRMQGGKKLKKAKSGEKLHINIRFLLTIF
jgi:hypothetical protein